MPAKDYGSAARRWEGVGPYYAMFPTRFADAVVAEFTRPGEIVLDPFAGRGTAIFSASSQGRRALGVEINSVGWCYAKAKLQPGSMESVLVRLGRIADDAPARRDESAALPEFFHYCFSPSVREFLLEARASLDWRTDQTDRTAMALLLVYLHGKLGSSLSNQMRQTKSMAPDYAVRWWKERGLEAPEIDALAFMAKRIAWRYAKGIPPATASDVYLGNAETRLVEISHELREAGDSASLIFTSPPYFGLTNYHYDQWLRLWLLGGEPNARRIQGSSELHGRFENAERYELLLMRVFAEASSALRKNGVVYVRTGRGSATLEPTKRALSVAFPRHGLQETDRPYSRPTQTSLFGDSSPKDGEVDLVMFPRT
jgi:hypothetical protein